MSTVVKKRVFGADLPMDIKKKLEARQMMASGEAAFGQEITSNYKEFYGQDYAKYKPEDVLSPLTN